MRFSKFKIPRKRNMSVDMQPASVLLNFEIMNINPLPFPLFVEKFCNIGHHSEIRFIHNSFQRFPNNFISYKNNISSEDNGYHSIQPKKPGIIYQKQTEYNASCSKGVTLQMFA